MGDIVTDMASRGLFGNVKNALVGGCFGVVFFLASFGILFWNEGRINFGKLAQTSLVASPEKVDAGLEGKLVSLTSPIDAKEEIGDPGYLKPGPWIKLERHAETYSWVETKKTETKQKTGGGSDEVTTYNYKKDWSSRVEPSKDFREPTGHENPPQTVSDSSAEVKQASLGAYSFVPHDAEVDTDRLALTPEIALVSKLERGGDESYLYVGSGSLTQPALGDVRLSYSNLARGTTVTLFGAPHGSSLGGFVYEQGTAGWIRVLKGSRDESIKKLLFEDTVIRWVIRAVGFFCMWFGMMMVLGPLEAVANILPFAGRVTHAAIGCLTFPLALGLTAATIVVSMVLHSLVATVVVGLVVFGIIIAIFKMKRSATTKAA
jgi:hypothetical protein